jgi:hypothetical protein
MRYYTVFTLFDYRKLLDAIISTGAHLNAKKWKEAALTFYSSMPHLMDFYRSNEDSALRRLKERYSDEQKRIFFV